MDTAYSYTSRKMWFGLKFILTESPIGTLRVLQIKLYTWKGNKEVEIRCDADTRPYAEN